MKNNYFLIGTILGLILAYLVGYLIMGRYVNELFGTDSGYNGIPAIFIGIIVALVAAVFLERKNLPKSFLQTGLVFPVIIFLLGSFAGCLVNLGLNGALSDYEAWFLKPLLALLMVGIPSSLAIGSTYYLFSKKLVSS